MARVNQNLTKADMVAEIAKRTGVDKAVVRSIIVEWMKLIKEALLNGFTVQLRGFGSFTTKLRAPKIARNISKGTSMEIPAHKAPCFKGAKDFMNLIKNG